MNEERLYRLFLLAESCTLEERKEVIDIARKEFGGQSECIDKLIDACEKAFEVSR